MKNQNPWERTELSMSKLMRIIDHAREIFYNKENAWSMRELARNLGVTVSYLYRYVTNKRELWFAVITLEFREFSNKVKEVILDTELVNRSDSLPEKQLVNAIAYFFEFLEKNPNRFHFMFLMKPPNAKVNNGPFEKHQNPEFMQILYKLLHEILLENQIDPDSKPLLGLHVWSHILGIATLRSPIYAYFREIDPNRNQYQNLITHILQDLPDYILREAKHL